SEVVPEVRVQPRGTASDHRLTGRRGNGAEDRRRYRWDRGRGVRSRLQVCGLPRQAGLTSSKQVMTNVILEALDKMIGAATPEERPGLVVALSARLASLGAAMTIPLDAIRSMEPPSPSSDARSTRCVRPDEAAELLSLPKSMVYRELQAG